MPCCNPRIHPSPNDRSGPQDRVGQLNVQFWRPSGHSPESRALLTRRVVTLALNASFLAHRGAPSWSNLTPTRPSGAGLRLNWPQHALRNGLGRFGHEARATVAGSAWLLRFVELSHKDTPFILKSGDLTPSPRISSSHIERKGLLAVSDAENKNISRGPCCTADRDRSGKVWLLGGEGGQGGSHRLRRRTAKSFALTRRNRLHKPTRKLARRQHSSCPNEPWVPTNLIFALSAVVLADTRRANGPAIGPRRRHRCPLVTRPRKRPSQTHSRAVATSCRQRAGPATGKRRRCR